jgi:hypothetical protein
MKIELLTLLFSSSFAIAMDKVTPQDRAQLTSCLRQIQYAVNYREKSGATENGQKAFLLEQYSGIEAIAKKYEIPHPTQRNFLWLCFLEEALKPNEHHHKKEMTKVLYEKAESLTKD